MQQLSIRKITFRVHEALIYAHSTNSDANRVIYRC